MLPNLLMYAVFIIQCISFGLYINKVYSTFSVDRPHHPLLGRLFSIVEGAVVGSWSYVRLASGAKVVIFIETAKSLR